MRYVGFQLFHVNGGSYVVETSDYVIKLGSEARKIIRQMVRRKLKTIKQRLWKKEAKKLSVEELVDVAWNKMYKRFKVWEITVITKELLQVLGLWEKYKDLRGVWLVKKRIYLVGVSLSELKVEDVEMSEVEVKSVKEEITSIAK